MIGYDTRTEALTEAYKVMEAMGLKVAEVGAHERSDKRWIFVIRILDDNYRYVWEVKPSRTDETKIRAELQLDQMEELFSAERSRLRDALGDAVIEAGNFLHGLEQNLDAAKQPIIRMPLVPLLEES